MTSCNTIVFPNGTTSATTSSACDTPFQLSLNRDSCILESYAAELAVIGGAELNVYKLLGIYEQGNMTDLTGFGTPLSSGDQPTFGAIHAFDLECREWRSLARGDDVTRVSYLGYDFGEVKLANGRNQYSVDSFVQKHITTLVIQQSENANHRVTKARIERSTDGKLWMGTAIITLPDDGNCNAISFKQSAAVRYWRIRPCTFNGGTNDYWTVRKLELMDYNVTAINNIQDEWGFMENRDREYALTPVTIKGTYELGDSPLDLTRLGLELPNVTIFKIPFKSIVAKLGRPIVIGDIIEIPSQAEFSVNLVAIPEFVEVTDVTWASEGFTPGWQAMIVRVTGSPMMAKQETMDIVGDFVKEKLMGSEAPGFLETDMATYSSLPFIANDRIVSAAKTLVQERGQDNQHMGIVEEEYIKAANELNVDIQKITNPETNGVYVRDGLPPEGLPYTESETLPDISKAKDGQYVRIIYPGNIDIPPRLFKFSLKKNKWVFLEQDERRRTDMNKTRASKFLNNPNRVNLTDPL